jgi:predicted acyl esterase
MFYSPQRQFLLRGEIRMSIDWHDLVSQPQYKMKVKKDLAVPVRDGIHLAADIYYPDAPGKFPVLIGFSPYVRRYRISHRRLSH